jgi:hypothetical protein
MLDIKMERSSGHGKRLLRRRDGFDGVTIEVPLSTL